MSPWIIAPVLLPALSGALILLALRNSLAMQRMASLAATGGLCLLAAGLLSATAPEAPQVYRLGDWPLPFGIALMLDPLSAMMVALTAGLALVVLIHVLATGTDRRGRHFHTLFQFQLMGLNGAYLTADAFNLFVFFEVLLIASYGLLIHGGGRDRLRAGVQYVAVNLFGSALFLFALATIYAVTGTLNMADLAVKVAALPPGDHALIRVAAVMMLAVFAIKGALVPFQFWLPVAYPNAPGAVAALFAVMTKVGAYAFLRCATLIFPPGAAPIGGLTGDLVLPAALVTLAVGSIGVLGAKNAMRQAAFAAIASMGTVFAALSVFTPQGTAAGLFYMVHSTLATAALFLIADQARGGQARDGQAPGGHAAALFMAAAVAMAGLPPLSGFPGKLMVLQSLPPGAWWVVLGGTFLMLLGFARQGSDSFWKAPAGAPAPTRALLAPALLIGALAALTLGAGKVIDWLIPVARALHAPAAYIAANQLPGAG
ncbi:MAG: monovalent cation/H+ antiporter subunit D [Paracoccaceae bacterium]